MRDVVAEALQDAAVDIAIAADEVRGEDKTPATDDVQAVVEDEATPLLTSRRERAPRLRPGRPSAFGGAAGSARRRLVEGALGGLLGSRQGLLGRLVAEQGGGDGVVQSF